MIHILVMGLLLATGLALALLASWRGWAPSLRVALAVGVALRLIVMVIAVRDSWQPYDLGVDFRDAARAVHAGQDPIAVMREGGWHFLPLLAYILAGQLLITQNLGVVWEVSGRIVPVLADIALIPLAGQLAAALVRGSSEKSARAALVRFQYACAPPAILVCAVHGQFVPITLLLGVGALLAARSGRQHVAGLLMGCAATTTSWAAFLLPGVLMSAAGRGRRIAIFLWTGIVPLAFLLSSSVFLGTALSDLPSRVGTILSARPVVGDWGWSVLLTGGHQEEVQGIGRFGMPILLGGLLAAAWWWRKAGPVPLTLALLLAFLIVTYRFGAQYLAWPLPYLLAVSARGTWPYIAAGSVWACFGYLYMTRGFFWKDAHMWWAYSSLIVIALLVYALPWRHARPATAAPPPEPEPLHPVGTSP